MAIQAAPDQVHAFLAEPENLPRWAPGFAQAVRADGDEVIVSSQGQDVRMTMVSSLESRTVDMTTGTDRRLGLFVRVLPNGDGSECVVSVAFGDNTPDAVVAAQMTVVAEELTAIRSLTEAGKA